MGKQKVGILFGGKSVEHDISVNSAKNIIANIDLTIFEPILIGITRDGDWHLCTEIDKDISAGKELTLSLSASSPKLFADNKTIFLDVVFPVLHGTDGEDGSIQGLLHTMNIPVVGSGVLGSAASMDKLLSKHVLNDAGIPVADFAAFSHNDRECINFNELVDQLGLPFMLKPVNLGSSVGVAKISSEKGFMAKVEDTFRYDNVIMFEEYLIGRELECAILGNEEAIASAPGEIVLSADYEFYSFTAKYEDPNAVELIVPAQVDDDTMEIIKAVSLKSFKVLNCKDFARVDLFLLEDGGVRVNEINTIPGFTNISMYPRLMKHEGIDYKELISQLIKLALWRNEAENRITTQFDSNL
jgi:D-alanine-D-alanine ligase